MPTSKLVITLMAACLAVLSTGPARSMELFENRVFDKRLAPGAEIQPGDTIGGYPIYLGGESWRLMDGNASVVPGPNALWVGSLTIGLIADASVVAVQNVQANLNRSFDSIGWRGGHCSNEHLFRKYDVSGPRETCLTIDPTVVRLETGDELFFRLTASTSAGQGRYLQNNLLVSGAALGFRERTANGWNPMEIQANEARGALMARLRSWGERLLEDNSRAFDQDLKAFATTPSPLTLVPVPDALKGQPLSPFFLGAIEDLRHRSDRKAIAYAPVGPGETVWATSSDRPTLEDAEREALSRCEERRKGHASPCKLFALP